MSFPAEFVQPPNEEVEKTGQKMAIPAAESTVEVKAFSGEQKQSLEKAPEGKQIAKNPKEHPAAAADRGPVKVKDDGGDPFPLRRKKPEEFQCPYCGNLNCNFCNEGDRPDNKEPKEYED